MPAQVPTTDPLPSLYRLGALQVSSSAVVQTQPHGYSAPGLDPMLSNGSGVEPSMLHDRTKELSAGGDPANAGAGPTVSEMSSDDVEWDGTLYLNGVCVRACARADEAAGDPFVLL